MRWRCALHIVTLISIRFDSIRSLELSSSLRSQVFGTTRPHPPLGQIGRPGTMSEIEELQRARFGTFWQAILTVFQVMTVEDWELVMYGFVRAQGYESSLYFLIWVIISKYTFLTLFLAVTLEVFEHKYKTEIFNRQRVRSVTVELELM